MALMDFIKKQFIDILQWTESGDGTLAWRFPMQEMEIQNGASLTVRDSQLALFVNEGTVADVFAPGMYKLTTQTLPVLTYLKNWDKLFESPFKSDLYFFSTRTQLDQKWGTPNPITIRDKEFGIVRLRAFGIYSYHLTDPKLFYQKISGTRDSYGREELEGQLLAVRNRSVAGFGVPAVLIFSLAMWVVTAVSLLLTKDEQTFEPNVTPMRHTFHIANRERRKLATVGVGAMMIGVLRTTRQVGLPLWALVIGISPEKSTFYIGIAAIIDFALFYTSGQIMDRFGRRWSAVPTMIGLGLTHIGLFLATDEPMFLVLAVLMSLANGLGSGLVLTLGSDLAPEDARAEFLAGYRLLVDAGVAAAPPVLSLLTLTVGLAGGMAAFGVLGLGSVWLLYRYIPVFSQSPTKS